MPPFPLPVEVPRPLTGVLIALLVGVCLCPVCRSDDRETKLPEDGTWVRYQESWERIDSGLSHTHRVTVSLVGSVREKDEPCRWIEVQVEIPEQGPEHGTYVFKMLFRERDLRENDNPLAGLVRAWMKFNDKPVYEFRPDELGQLPTLLWAPGVLKHAKAVDGPKDVEYQQGRLKEARARAGELVLLNNPRPDWRMSWEYQVWMHPDLPLGFAEARCTFEMRDNERRMRTRQITEYRLQDSGTGAKTALPDSN